MANSINEIIAAWTRNTLKVSDIKEGTICVEGIGNTVTHISREIIISAYFAFEKGVFDIIIKAIGIIGGISLAAKKCAGDIRAGDTSEDIPSHDTSIAARAFITAVWFGFQLFKASIDKEFSETLTVSFIQIIVSKATSGFFTTDKS